MSKWAFVLAGVLPLLADPSPARADPTTAEALFREGRQLLDAGKYQAACLKLAESQRQDPASGTLINLALCYELDGKLATAWALYRSTASLARQDGRPDRQQSAEQKAAALETRVPRLILHMEHLPARGLLIQGPNGPLGAGALGSPIPVDPGSYRVTVSAPGYRDWSAELVIHEAESPTLEIPALEPDAPASRAAAPRPIAQTSSPPTRQVAPPPAPRSSRGQVALLSVGGLSLAAFGVGTYFGIASLSAYSRAEDRCPTHHGCSLEALSERDDAQTKAWIANGSIAAGLVGTAACAWLLFRPARAEAVAVRAAWLPGGAGIAVAGSH